MIWNKIDIERLLAIGLATIDESGNLLGANDGFMRLIQDRTQRLLNENVERFFIQPDLKTILGMPADAGGRIFHGLLTLGDYAGLTRTLNSTIWRESSTIRVFVEYDVEGLESLSNTVSELNRDYARAQHDLAQVNIKLKQVISELDQRQEEIAQLAFYDSLTSLPNRRLLNDRLNQTLVASKRNGFLNALLFIDLDNFKLLNDTHGHGAGDLLLIEAADRLKNCVREMDTVARFGGDEFVIILNELTKSDNEATSQAEMVAVKILAALSAPYKLTLKPQGGPDTFIEHRCTGSIGVVIFADSDLRAEDILKWADTAMYQAKEAGKGQIRFHTLVK